MQYLGEQGLQQFLNNLYASAENIENDAEEVDIKYNVFIDDNLMNGNFTLTTYNNNSTLYIVKNI